MSPHVLPASLPCPALPSPGSFYTPRHTRWPLCCTARQVCSADGSCHHPNHARNPVCWRVVRHTHSPTPCRLCLLTPPAPRNTTETNNEVNTEEAAKGEPDQYLHINTIQGVVCPSLETLQLLNTLHCEPHTQPPRRPARTLCGTFSFSFCPSGRPASTCDANPTLLPCPPTTLNHVVRLDTHTHLRRRQTPSSTAGRGFSDHVNALLVGVDLLKKALEGRQELAKARARKRLLLLGTFDTQVWTATRVLGSVRVCGFFQLPGVWGSLSGLCPVCAGMVLLSTARHP